MVVVLARFMRMLLVCVPKMMMPAGQMITAKMLLLFYETMAREKRRILSELVQVKGLMPLLMKPRNFQKWTSEDKGELRLHLKRLSRMSAYLALLVMPGGFAMLPVMAWWLDRRSRRRGAPQVPQHVTHAAQAHQYVLSTSRRYDELAKSKGPPR
jgi:hypothetical protein